MGAQRSKELLFSSIPLGEAGATLPGSPRLGVTSPLTSSRPTSLPHPLVHFCTGRPGGPEGTGQIGLEA